MHNFLKKIRNLLNKVLIPILVKHEMYYVLSLLLILNLNKIKKILPKNSPKYKVIVLSKSGGVEDLIESQKKYNNNFLYLSCPRPFFKHIFSTIFQNKKNLLNDYKYSTNINEIEILKMKYKKFLISFLKVFKKKYNFNMFIGFNFNYLSERELHVACSELKIPFLLLFKESIHTKIQEKYFLYTYKKVNEKFNGYKVAVYSNYAKKLLKNSNIINKNNIEVIGCSRLASSYSCKKIEPKNQILYYAIQNNRGLPNSLIKSYSKKFFSNFSYHKNYNLKYNWTSLHKKILKLLKKFAINNPNISIIIKVKIGDSFNTNEYKNLPKNVKIFNTGVGNKFLEDSKVVIGWNTTAILEAIAANRFILLPYFNFNKQNKIFNSAKLKLELKKINYGYTEDDFYKKLNLLVRKKYNKGVTNNNLNSLEYYLGNKDNNAGLRLNKFLKNNLLYK
jgi:hypothetical protein